MSNQKHPGGRPTKYKPEYVEQVAKLCALGATDKDIADFFGVDESNLNEWKNKFPEFRESIKTAKYDHDHKVERSLLERATGYSHPEDKIFNNNGEPLVVPTVRHYPPDPTSMIFWLKNRQPKRWRDKQEVQHTGHVAHSDVPLNQEEAEAYKQSIEGLYGAVEESTGHEE